MQRGNKELAVLRRQSVISQMYFNDEDSKLIVEHSAPRNKIVASHEHYKVEPKSPQLAVKQ